VKRVGIDRDLVWSQIVNSYLDAAAVARAKTVILPKLANFKV
jgi:hypothetical protein